MRIDISEEIKNYYSWERLVIYDLSSKDFTSAFEDIRLIRYIFEETVNYPEGLIYIEKLFDEIYNLSDEDSINRVNKVQIISGILKCLTYIEESKLGNIFERIFNKSLKLSKSDLGILEILIEFFESGYSNKNCFDLLKSRTKYIPDYLLKYFESVENNLKTKGDCKNE